MSKKKIKEDGSLFYRQRDLLRPIGLGMTVVGIIWFWIGISMASYYVPMVITPVGIILFFIGASRSISQSDLEGERDHALNDYDQAARATEHFDRLVLKQPSDVETGAYNYGEDAAYFRRGKNGTLMSDVYARTHIWFTKDGILLASRKVCLTRLNDPDGGISDTTRLVPFTALVGATLDEHTTSVTLTNTKKTATVRWCELVLTGHDGELLRVPAQNDMDCAGVCEEINRRIQKNQPER